MGLFSKLFGWMQVRYVYNGSSSRSAPFSKEIYEQEVVRSIIDCIATHAAKAEAMHVIVGKDGRIKEIKRNSQYVKLLNMRPNPLMTGYDLKYKLITHLETNTTALCYIKWNGTNPEMFIPIAYKNFEIFSLDGGGYAVKFIDYEGIQVCLPLEDIVVLRKFFNTREVGGDGNDPIYNTLDMLKATDEGLIEAVSVSNKIRGILKQKRGMLDSQDVKQSTKQFTERFEYAAKHGGIVGVDSMEDFAPLQITAWSANALQMKEVRENALRYWRISNAFLTSDYTESQWQASYESVIEPKLIQMGQAFTNACFTQGERDAGNRIIFVSSVLLNTSMQTKVAILNSAREIGLFTKNELREMFGYAPVEGGDEAQVSLNYVKATDQSKYQTGEEPDQGGNDGQN